MTLVNPAYEVQAPKYRYYTVDLLTDEVLAEIPFGGVRYARAIKGAGTFSGTIPVLPTEHSRAMNLYESTMPGPTGLYILRNDECVWGGIIWSRQYDVVGRKMTVNASEFTSYFYHRRIWKTWSHQFGAKVVVADGVARVLFDWGAAADLNPGASVFIEFDRVIPTPYDGHYVIASDPRPTEDDFYISGAVSTVKVIAVERTANVVSVQTEGAHRFNTGDRITLTMDEITGFNGTGTITVESANTDRFTFTLAGENRASTKTTGKATRPLPNGTWIDVTVSVRTDTYEYIRSLVGSVFDDFTGIDFPNTYIEPGVAYKIAVINKQLAAGLATIQTENEHDLAIGQSVRVENVGPLYDGEVEVVDVPNPTSFRFRASGIESPGAVTPVSATIVARSVTSKEVTITTASAHNFKVGQRVAVDSGLDPDGQESVFNGVYTIKEVPTATTFRYTISLSTEIPHTALVQPTATVSGQTRNVIRKELTGNKIRLTTREPHGFIAGNSVTIANVSHTVPIVERELDVVRGEATIATVGAHGLSVGDAVTLNGFSDVFAVTEKTVTGSGATKAVSMKTSTPHNLSVGKTIAISGMDDTYAGNSFDITSNVATVSTKTNHNITNGSLVTIKDAEFTIPVGSGELTNGTAILTMTSTKNIQVGDIVKLTYAPDFLLKEVQRVRVDRGIVTLTLAREHNFTDSDKVTISNLGMGAIYEGEVDISSVSPMTISYELDVDDREDINIAERKTAGNILYPKGFYVGQHTVEGVSSTSISFSMEGKDMPQRNFTPSGVLRVPARVNGTWTTTAATATTISFALTMPNQASTSFAAPEKADEPGPTITQQSIFNGTKTITAVTQSTFSFNQAVTNAVATLKSNGSVTVDSIFNGSRTITAIPTVDSFRFVVAGQVGVRETVSNMKAYVRANGIFNVTGPVVDVVDTHTFTVARTHADILPSATSGYGSASVEPVIIAGSYGPYPGNADINVEFSTQGYSGKNITPISYRGFELANAGEALDKYSDSIDGFEYRIDCVYDKEAARFRRIFVLLPIDFPNPPQAGEVSPISRFGADKLVFEYPGNIDNINITESAENAATRFFAIGSTDLGPEAGPPFSVAAADDLLNGKDGRRRWPLMDDDEKIDDINDESVLYAYAKRYLSESRPPNAKLSVSVNGSLAPTVGSYAPGQWCSLVVDDEFLRQRLASDLEPRDDVIVRKIDSFEVSVPDGTTFPEKVTLNLVPEWEVDKRG